MNAKDHIKSRMRTLVHKLNILLTDGLQDQDIACTGADIGMEAMLLDPLAAARRQAYAYAILDNICSMCLEHVVDVASTYKHVCRRCAEEIDSLASKGELRGGF